MRAERIDLRITYEEKKAFVIAAKRKNMKLAEWISSVCMDALIRDVQAEVQSQGMPTKMSQ